MEAGYAAWRGKGQPLSELDDGVASGRLRNAGRALQKGGAPLLERGGQPRQLHANPPDFNATRLDALQRHAFEYFLHETNPANGLVADKSQPGAPASIAAVGFALAVYPVGVTRAWITRTDAIERTLAVCGSSGPARRARRQT